jgi:hypothetical protein
MSEPRTSDSEGLRRRAKRSEVIDRAAVNEKILTHLGL